MHKILYRIKLKMIFLNLIFIPKGQKTDFHLLNTFKSLTALKNHLRFKDRKLYIYDVCTYLHKMVLQPKIFKSQINSGFAKASVKN